MSINEKLIAEARTHRAAPGYEADVDMIRRLADALEAAEKAHIPTDDERKAVVLRAIRAADDADEYGDPVIEAWSDGERFTSADLRALAAGFRRSEVSEPSAAGWSTEDRREAIAESDRRWSVESQHSLVEQRDHDLYGMGAQNGFILGAEWWKLTHRRPAEPQGEPSDAQVRAAVNAWHRTEGTERADWYDNPINRERMRAALRAAMGVQ